MIMPSKKSLIIVGGGGFAREVIWLARESSDEWQIKGILDDDDSIQGQNLCDVPVIGKVDDWKNYSDTSFIIAIGTPRIRKTVVQRMESKGDVKYAKLIHPSVQLSKYVDIGDGSIVTAGCILTTQIQLGRHSIVNLAATIGHDVTFKDYCTIAPQVAISGNVSFGDGVEIGTKAIIIQGITIGTGSFVGAGSIVTKDIINNVLAVGLPARQVKTLDEF